MGRGYSTHGKTRKGDHQSDFDVAYCNMRRARHEHAMAKRAFGPRAAITFAGDPSEPTWGARVKAQHDLFGAEWTRKNLDKLIKLDDSGMCRRLGFDRYGMLVIDGDWICILNGGNDEVCLDCAKKLLLAGEMAPDDAWAYLLYVDQPEYSVACSECQVELWHVDEEEEDGEEEDLS